MFTLTTPLLDICHYIDRVGNKTSYKLSSSLSECEQSLPINKLKVEDLLFYLPFRYEDRSSLPSIRDLTDGKDASVEVTIKAIGNRSVKSKAGKLLSVFEIVAQDLFGQQLRAFWWNQSYLANVFIVGQRVILYGQWKYSNRRGCFQVENPEYEIIDDGKNEENKLGEVAKIHTGRCVPIYRKLGQFRTRWLRSLIYKILELVTDVEDEFLPIDLLDSCKLPSRIDAFRQVHFPNTKYIDQYSLGYSQAHSRLAIEEFFLLSIALLGRSVSIQTSSKTGMEVNDRIRQVVRSILPVKPTNAQKRVIREIVSDMTSTCVMNRLLQGDVGSGKTLVAIQAMVVAIENGYQVAMMVPTEILAEQHTLTISQILRNTQYRIAGLTGRLKLSEKRSIRQAIAAGEIDLVIGTQALIQDETKFTRLGLVVIDEQHRFGVIQRAQLVQRGINPDVLVMTATPIPRSLAMIGYGDLNVSVLDELPPGRKPIRTVLRTESQRENIYKFIRQEVVAGRQIYIVFPLVEESEKLDLQAATNAAKNLQEEIFPELKIGLLHGKMKSSEKEQVMLRFASNEYQILVATTVIEVGIDVPNASVMLIEHPERFGLAQLHQLRGRVGRGTDASYCILMDSPKNSMVAKKRLSIFASTHDGFVIAEKDLEIRGPGEVFGTKQSGIPLLRVGNIVQNRDWLEIAHNAAKEFLKEHRYTKQGAKVLELASNRFSRATDTKIGV